MFVYTFLIYKWHAALLKTLMVTIKNFVWTWYVDRIKQGDYGLEELSLSSQYGWLGFENFESYQYNSFG